MTTLRITRDMLDEGGHYLGTEESRDAEPFMAVRSKREVQS